MPHTARCIFGLLIITLLMPAGALADSIFVGTLERRDVTIREIKDRKLIFNFAGRVAEQDLDRITRLVVANEAVFNAAEEAFASGQWERAVDGYLRTLRSTNKDWLRDYVAWRMVTAANQVGRFDAATTAYVHLLQRAPTLASDTRPAMPDAGSTFLNTAANEVNQALANPRLTADQRRALLTFQLDIQRARNDTAAAAKVLEQLVQISPDTAADPAARRALADVRLGAIMLALDKKDYETVEKEIDAHRAVFEDPRQQADALWALAEVRYAQAERTNTPTAWKDAALAYMRVVGHFEEHPNRPRVAESLLKTGLIMARLQDTKAATQLLEQVVSRYPTDPAAQQARQELQRLKGTADHQTEAR
jgi:tetratricopeptide (TPR) repeat protein